MSPTPAAPKGGQKSPPPPDRIDTPDAINVAEVMRATAQAEREKQVRLARQNRHMSDCLTFRSQDCNCPANLANLPKALEEKMTGDVKWIRVDEEHFITVRVPDPSSHRGPLINKQVLVQPLWICTGCGTSQRVPHPIGHLCDPALLAWKEKPVPLSLTVAPEKRHAGAYRITIWRDADFKYHVGEVVIEGGTVVAESELDVNGYYPASEATLSDLVAREFSP